MTDNLLRHVSNLCNNFISENSIPFFRKKMSRLECLKLDPMKNDLVLERIFQFCDVPSLKTCRLVSHKWKNLSLKSWRNKAVIQLNTKEEESLDFADFLKLVDPAYEDTLQLRKHPFKRYSVQLNNCYPGRAEYCERKHLVIAISNFRASHVKIIWTSDNFNGLDELLTILNLDSLVSLEVNYETLWVDIPESVMPLKYSNLKRLKLYQRRLSHDHAPVRSLSPFLLKSFPKLEALIVAYAVDKNSSTSRKMQPVDRLEIVKLLKDMRQSGGENVLPLKELEMIDINAAEERSERFREAEIIDALTECKFPLERLSIHIGYYGGNEILILQLLESCKDTLQYLKASNDFNNDSYIQDSYVDQHDRLVESAIKPFQCPTVRMEALKEIVLLNGLEWALFLLSHLDIPKLEKLSVEYDSDRSHEKRSGKVLVSFPEGKIYEKLETFHLHDNQKMLGGKAIRRLAKMMPNLAHLTIPLEKSTFPVICRYFKGLKSLNILSGEGDYEEIDDETLTGISKGESKEGGGVPYNITDLEHLSDLRISCERQLKRGEVKFTEHSVIYGFLQLPRLFHLSVALNEVSEPMMEKLVSHVKGHVDLQRKVKPAPTSFELEIVSGDHSSSSSTEEEQDSGEDEDEPDPHDGM